MQAETKLLAFIVYASKNYYFDKNLEDEYQFTYDMVAPGSAVIWLVTKQATLYSAKGTVLHD